MQNHAGAGLAALAGFLRRDDAVAGDAELWCGGRSQIVVKLEIKGSSQRRAQRDFPPPPPVRCIHG
jgi:hypothetical protein